MSAPAPFDSFVILAGMRTGSNFLEENLNAVSGLRCYGEAFNPHFLGGKDRQVLLGVTRQGRDADPGTLLDAMRRADEGMPGFRFFHDHDARVLDRVLADRRCAKIVLTRNPAESYVSLRIAGETGQWRLTDLKHARGARVRFDPQDFAAYLETVRGFQRTVLHALQSSGQTAFHLSYEDVGDLDVLNGMLRFLGVEARLEAVTDRLKKQNPQALADKVTNFPEMERALADLDLFGLAETPSFEPRRGPGVPAFVAAPDAPLMYLPIRGGPVERVEAWLSALDGMGVAALRRGFTQKTLRKWKRDNPGHRCFTVVSHPLTRAHRAFVTHILPATGPDSLPAIRAALRDSYGVPLPPGDPGPDRDAAAHRAAFLAFLRFLKGNLGGQTGLRVDASWASQTRLLEGMAQAVQPDMVLREETLARDLGLAAAQIGADPPALPPESVPEGPVPLSAICDDEVEAAARDAYQRDYLGLGYGAWRD